MSYSLQHGQWPSLCKKQLSLMQGCVLMVQMKKLRGPSESGHKLNRLWYYFLDRSPASICKQTSSSLFATYHKMINTDGKPVRDRLLVTPLVTPAGWPACLHTAGVERGLGVVTARPQQVNRSSWWHDVFQRKSQQQFTIESKIKHPVWWTQGLSSSL